MTAIIPIVARNPLRYNWHQQRKMSIKRWINKTFSPRKLGEEDETGYITYTGGDTYREKQDENDTLHEEPEEGEEYEVGRISNITPQLRKYRGSIQSKNVRDSIRYEHDPTPRALRLNESRQEIENITSQLEDITLEHEGKDLDELKERYEKMARSTPTDEGDSSDTTMMPVDMTAREVEPQRSPILTRVGHPIRTWTPPLGDLSSIRREMNNTLMDIEDPEQQDSWELMKDTTVTRTQMRYDEVDDDTHLSTLTEPAGGVEEQALEEVIEVNGRLPMEVNEHGGIMGDVVQGYFGATETGGSALADELEGAWQEESHEEALSLAEEIRQIELREEMREEVEAEITRLEGKKRTKPRFGNNQRYESAPIKQSMDDFGLPIKVPETNIPVIREEKTNIHVCSPYCLDHLDPGTRDNDTEERSQFLSHAKTSTPGYVTGDQLIEIGDGEANKSANGIKTRTEEDPKQRRRRSNDLEITKLEVEPLIYVNEQRSVPTDDNVRSRRMLRKVDEESIKQRELTGERHIYLTGEHHIEEPMIHEQKAVLIDNIARNRMMLRKDDEEKGYSLPKFMYEAPKDDSDEVRPPTDDEDEKEDVTEAIFMIEKRNISPKKPQTLSSTILYPDFLASFKNYAELMGIPKEDELKHFFTFLDPALLRKVRSIELSEDEMKDPDECYKRISFVMNPPASKLGAQLRLGSLRQGDNSLMEFVDSIRQAGLRSGFNAESRRVNMLNCLISGVRDTDVYMRLAERLEGVDGEKLQFEEAAREAILMETRKDTRTARMGYKEHRDMFEIAVNEEKADKTTAAIIEKLQTKNLELEADILQLKTQVRQGNYSRTQSPNQSPAQSNYQGSFRNPGSYRGQYRGQNGSWRGQNGYRGQSNYNQSYYQQNRGNQRGYENSQIICFQCKLPGHIARDCKQPREVETMERYNNQMASNKHKMQSDQLAGPSGEQNNTMPSTSVARESLNC